MFKSKKQV